MISKTLNAGMPAPPAARKRRLKDLIHSQEEVTGQFLQYRDSDIFHPGLRKQLRQARREQKERERAREEIRSRSQVVELNSGNGFVKLRVGDRCWLVPREDVQHRHVPRIWMATSDCPDATRGLSFR